MFLITRTEYGLLSPLCRVWSHYTLLLRGAALHPNPTRILGVDPGSRLCGWGIIDRNGTKIHHVDNGVFMLVSEGELPARLGLLMASLQDLLERYKPDSVAVEGVFQHRNARSALVLGHARGVALAVCAQRGLQVSEYSPLQVKKALTGSGRASKEQMQQMVALRLSLQDVPQEDAADAVAVAVCHAQHSHLASAAPLLKKTPSKRNAKAALRALAMAQERNRK
jgi:crossover junction endodeoxyribonuclease RuvC